MSCMSKFEADQHALTFRSNSAVTTPERHGRKKPHPSHTVFLCWIFDLEGRYHADEVLTFAQLDRDASEVALAVPAHVEHVRVEDQSEA